MFDSVVCVRTVLMYTWFKGAIPNFVRTELKPYIFISNFGKLYFSYVTKDDQDNYYCQVSAPRATMTAATGKVSLPIPLRVSEDSKFSVFLPNIR